MLKPKLPADEAARLTTLHSLNLLDSPAEERFDRVTRMAKRMFDVPIALVSIVDENRQWFKSRLGTEMCQTERDISFCGHAILGDEPFIICDATKDPRFADNPLVTSEPHIRFYAGCPLRAFDQTKLGTLCIIDTHPRLLTSDELESLVDLARMIENEFAAYQLATMCELTNISNRRGFMLLAQHSLQLCAREQLPASLVFIDLDDFKQINDRLGHKHGDRLLKEFANQLSQVFRDADVVARLGGDEFVVLLSNARKTQAEEALKRLNALTTSNELAERCGCAIAFSSGVVEYDPERHPSLEALLEAGDKQMYHAKQAKKRC